jgi:hypothetical protein
MHAQCKETRQRMGPTPLLPTPAKDIVPEGAPISDNDSVVLSTYSQHSEPDGEFRDDDDYDSFVHICEPPLAPNIVNEGAGPNLVPEGTSPSRLMRELLYPLPQILDDGLVIRLSSILLLGGFEEQMEEWSMSIYVSLGT